MSGRLLYIFYFPYLQIQFGIYIRYHTYMMIPLVSPIKACMIICGHAERSSTTASGSRRYLVFIRPDDCRSGDWSIRGGGRAGRRGAGGGAGGGGGGAD